MPAPSVFDVFAFSGATTSDILSSGFVISSGDVTHIGADPLGTGYVFLNGNLAGSAQIFVDQPVSSQWTLEFEALMLSLPSDFTNLATDYVFFGAVDTAGEVAGFYLSRAGIAYAPCLGGAVTFLEHSELFTPEGSRLTFRVAVDKVSKNTYVYITPTDDLPRIGHQLRYILPAIGADRCPVSVLEGVTVAVGGRAKEVSILLSSLALSDKFVVPNLAPVADAGTDQTVRHCAILRLDGTASFDPEGAPLSYGWRLVDAPLVSGYAFGGVDGSTPTADSPPGAIFTDKFYSPTFHGVSIPVGTVLLVRGKGLTIVETGLDALGDYVRAYVPDLLVGMSDESFKIVYQNGLRGETTTKPTFYPDIEGFYKFDLVVYDGELVSSASTTVVNVVESLVPHGVTPDLRFFWGYLSNFWSLVEDRERIETFWSAAAQIVAGEMLSLWQIDYGKSLRDIQRTFQRRWLHYDLLVSESLPELTTVTARCAAPTSTELPTGGITASGQTLLLSWPGGTAAVTLTGTDPLLPDNIFLQIKTALLKAPVTPTKVLNRTSGYYSIRLTSALPVTIEAASTASFFTPGIYSGPISGTGGVPVALRTYKTSQSLLGLGLQENDLITIDGQGYRLVRAIDDASDQYPFQRLLVKEDLPLTAGATWSFSSSAVSTNTDFYVGLFDVGDHVTLEVITVSTGSIDYFVCPVLAVAAGAPNSIGIDIAPVAAFFDTAAYELFLFSAQRKTHIPLDDLVSDIPYLQIKIKDAPKEELLHRNADFYIEQFRGQNSIRLDPLIWVNDAAGLVEDTALPARLWAETTYLDNTPTIEGNFGLAANFTLDDVHQIGSNLDYLSAVRGLWYAYLSGPTVFNMRVGTQILLGLPYAEETGIIEEIRTDFSPTRGRILIRDAKSKEVVRSYHFPAALKLEINPATGLIYAVGDTALVFAPLVTGAEVLDYVSDPTWFQNYLAQGVFNEVEKFWKFMVRVDSSAFNLSALLFCRSFIQRIKPTSAHGFFVVRKEIGPDEINVTDQVTGTVRIYLFEGAWFNGRKGEAGLFDDPRSGGAPTGTLIDGGLRWRSRFDEDFDPDNAPPVPPTPDAVTWGFDTDYLAPVEAITAILTEDFTGIDPLTGLPYGDPFLPPFESIFAFDDPVYLASDVTFSTPIAWAFDTTLPAAVYSSLRVLV